MLEILEILQILQISQILQILQILQKNTKYNTTCPIFLNHAILLRADL